MFKPSSTYRIQFHKDFDFNALDQIIPYLIKLGIDTLYASPIFEAVPGSTHGYDVVNPWMINPEIGTEQQLIAISKKLKHAGISWLQDIVPNHMAFHPDNKWLMDVLKNGSESAFASFFDIDFKQGDGKLMVPFLGEDLDEAIANKTLKVEEIDGTYFLNSGDANWPLNAETVKKLSKENLKALNKNDGELKKIVNAQHYRLCNWQETNTRINYRRFFTVNGLICINIQHQNAYDLYHKYIFELVEKGVFQGLRIDHIDGLYDPKQYLDRLRKSLGNEVYIVVEKILESGEEMPSNWNAQGNTGYDFLAIANNLFTNTQSKKRFNEIYQQVIDKKLNPSALIYQKKTAILFEHMQGELNNLCALFLSLKLIEVPESELKNLKLAIAEMLIQMPVYRYYNYDFPLNTEDEKSIKTLLKPILYNKKLSNAGNLLHEAFLEKPLLNKVNYNKKIKQFYQRCMQFTGPLMAKGVEDTVMFTYNRFVGHTEVGDAPDAFGLTANEFHQKMLDRQKNWPLSLNGSSTHDTKKGEDVRARLNVLTDLPEDWATLVNGLLHNFKELQSIYPSFKWLHKNDIYLIIQTIIGALPFTGEDDDDIDLRLEQFIQKALREAKKRSDWADPNEKYEAEMNNFSQAILDKKHNSRIKIKDFLNDISDFAIVNSLAQLTLKFTCPGIPDLYQGTELWDLSLVDPDNRRPVDFEIRDKYLNEIDGAPIKTLWTERSSGKVKLWLTKQLLEIRKVNKDVFEQGAYIPLQVKGKFSKYVCAFARKFEEAWIMTTIPLGLAELCKSQNVSASKFKWADTQILLPIDAPLTWMDLLTDKQSNIDILNQGISLNEIFNEIPISVIKLLPKNHDRSAGILMHISSLPSNFGIGDFGKNAFEFVDFLQQSKQKYWQILPLNPTKAENGHSPYSSNSAMAGNVLLISPEGLAEDELLLESDLNIFELPSTNIIDFEKTEKVKRKLLKKAYKNFVKSGNDQLQKDYASFCITASDWLDNFSIYTSVKQNFKNLEWYNWPNEFKYRDSKTLANFEKENQKEIEEIKWEQFIFYRQWYKLKQYANEKKVQIIGDLPFYLDYDSVEVWSQPSNFLLDKKLNKIKVAGVPPDYFNEKGQLWGMPIFNWEVLKEDGYTWWINRLKKNLELYDLIRLDHFRAFSSYWEVPAENEDAINGVWQPGPNADFFKIIKENLGELPFIAEDLGDINDDVEQLRMQFKLPGMKVLQFSFGADLSGSAHMPHNYKSTNCIVYSGTHDNNTLQGWFQNEIDLNTLKRISIYAGMVVNKNNINKIIIKLCYSSIAKIAIIPIQDILSLDESTRMNLPGTNEGNWLWRLKKNEIKPSTIIWLKQQTEMYGRNV